MNGFAFPVRPPDGTQAHSRERNGHHDENQVQHRQVAESRILCEDQKVTQKAEETEKRREPKGVFLSKAHLRCDWIQTQQGSVFDPTLLRLETGQ